MAESAPLSVLVTRPGDAGVRLADRIADSGGEPFRFAPIEIVAVHGSADLDAAIGAAGNADWAIFVSPAAARIGVAAVRARMGCWPRTPRVAAVGPGTARVLDGLGVAVELVPESSADSEGLLAAPALAAVAGSQVIIFRGAGGRELLTRTLSRRGARIHHADCYRRQRTTADRGPLIERWHRRPFDRVVLTSIDIVDALLEVLGPSARLLLDSDLVVVSARIERACRERGCTGTIVVAAGADDDQVLDALGLPNRTGSARTGTGKIASPTPHDPGCSR